MIEVSKEYMNKALASGRKVRCEIAAGNFTYTDADIISFEFNDVIHPEDMVFGTTCANRFSFELWSRRNIPLSAVIRPFIMFEDESGVSEKCPLGEFYISRRFRKRERLSITCHDRMFRLDARYRPLLLSLPCTAEELLTDIAEQYQFKIGFKPQADVIESIPRNTTCREIIGYIAGLNGGFAKFDRGGVLQLRKLKMCNFVLARNQYTSLSLKADPLEVRRVELIGESETFAEGRGTRFTTYRQYNPFANKDAAKRVFAEWGGFSYHGMTVKMRGLPFIESGDSIQVQDDFEDKHYTAIISEYTLEYDGGLRATLISKSKNPVDEYEEPVNKQRLLESLNESLRMRFYNYVNERNVTVTTAETTLANINFNLESYSFIVFNSQFTVTAASDCVLTMNYKINNIKTGQSPRTYLKGGSPVSVCLYNCFDGLPPGRSGFTLSASVSTGSGVINEGDLTASISGQLMLGESGPLKPEINISEEIEKFGIEKFGGFGFKNFSAEVEFPPIPDRKTDLNQEFGRFSIPKINFPRKND